MTAAVRTPRMVLAAVFALILIGALIAVNRSADRSDRTMVTGYFDNSTGLFVGDDVRIRGVRVGEVVKIQPEALRTKITFWFDRKYKVPADAKAVILSPQLVTGRAVQLTPPYTGGPTMAGGAVIDQDRTAVPVEWDDIRAQLVRLTEMLQPETPGGVSSLGALINSAAGNLAGQGASIRDTIVKLSKTVSVLNDHSADVFGTIRNLSTLVSGLRDSSDLLAQLNVNLAEVSALLADDPDKVGRAVEDLNGVVNDVQGFVAENREPIGTASDRLRSISEAVAASLDDVKQFLHVAPNVAVNFNNIYEPANGSLTGALQVNNFANPISFLCGAIEAASRLGAEQAAKLCVQYLAPIVKNRQYNFPPLGENLFVGAQARPNEVTYSEDWMRPDFVPPQTNSGETPPPAGPVSFDPAAGLAGLMAPAGGWVVKRRRWVAGAVTVMTVVATSGCGWQGLNSLPLPGTEGNGPGSFEIRAQMPDVSNIQPNSRVRVGDVTVGHVSKIALEGNHALVTMKLNGDVELPANATANIGLTTIFGSLHIELAAPTDQAPQGKLGNGALIPLSRTAASPTPEQTLAALSLVLNGGGVGQAGDITRALSTAFRGREQDLRSLIEQSEKFATTIDEQSGDIISATESLNNLVGKFADQQPVLDRAVQTIPDALAVLNTQQDNLVEAADQLSKFGALTTDTVNRSKENLIKELQQVGPVLKSLADAGPALTRSLGVLPTYPFPNANIDKWQRGDSANLTAVIDLTLSRLDAGLFTGTRWECNLTQLELQWGRTIGQFPSPCLDGRASAPANPLTAPYNWDQGP